MPSNTWDRHHALLSAGVLALTCLLSPAAMAAEPMRPLQWTRVDDMSFISGGVGMRERRELFERVDHYDVLFSFAERESGQFLTNVRIDLSSKQHEGPPVSLWSAGPYLFAQLPEGQYELTASAPGWQRSSYELEVRPYHHERIYVTLEKEPAPLLSQR